MSYVKPLLSRIIDDNNVSKLDALGLDRDFFPPGVERDAYDFIRKYAADHDQAPSYAAVVTEVPDFVYVPDVTDSYEYMARRIKEAWGQAETQRFMQSKEHADKFAEVGRTISYEEYYNWFTSSLDLIRQLKKVCKVTSNENIFKG